MTVNNRFTEFAGELGCVDIYHHPIEINNEGKTYYLFGIIDSCTQIVWVELIEDLEALCLMFKTLKCFTVFSDYYNIKFRELLSNGSIEEVLKGSTDRINPFDMLLIEKGVIHKKGQGSSYAEVLNANIKEFWASLHIDLIKGTIYEDKDELKNKIISYLYYYNEKRVHKNLRGMTPTEFNKTCPRHI
ncbi:IS3 family transposase [Pseudofulvibacter geojedonensis]|uniref:IS3 family transposase n=1 Tax=Pseudofulvibacter geojedonensis TaxID=1123758 RepID=A0ABW3I1Z0_9FLAO